MNSTIKKTLIVLGVPTLYAILVRLFFGIKFDQLFEVMSLTFLLCVPTIIGALTVFLSDEEKAKKRSYQFLAPWKPVLLFFIITLLFNIEGWACWIMILPIFLIAASIGGLIGGYFKSNPQKDRFSISLIVFLPFLLAPMESLIQKIPATYEAYTFIDINGPAEKIWDNVTRVRTIKEEEDTGWLNKFLGFPRPVQAELDFEGVGAYREAIFTNGLVFHETVTEYEDNKLMVFDIKAFPHEIPSTTLDEHVVIGGDYFDVLNGKYELEDLGNGLQRLHLSSRFEMKTTFNFYAGWWGKWIMKDIQNNILKVSKKRVEEG
jgi:hypothetical protein